MEVPDTIFIRNRDWDPSYSMDLFQEDFYEFSELWKSNVHDMELVAETDKVECYCPIAEEISMDDDTLCQAVDNIERE